MPSVVGQTSRGAEAIALGLYMLLIEEQRDMEFHCYHRCSHVGPPASLRCGSRAGMAKGLGCGVIWGALHGGSAGLPLSQSFGEKE